MFVFKVHKNDEISIEVLQARTKACIESVLYDLGAVIAVTGNMIIIIADDIKANECKEKIKGCLCGSSGTIYPEFLRVELLP